MTTAVLKNKKDEERSTFQRCRDIDVSDIVSQNYQGVNYISWADAWKRLKEHFPDAWFKIHEFDEENSTNKVPYLKTQFGVWVRISVGLGISVDDFMTESLPVMDSTGKAVVDPDARDINDNIKRCLVKAMALHGFGLSVYEKDDLYAKGSQSHMKPSHETKANLTQGGEFRIQLPKNNKLNNKTLAEAGFPEVNDNFIYWSNRVKAEGRKSSGGVKEFLDHAAPWIKANQKMGIQPPEPTPFSDDDIGWPK